MSMMVAYGLTVSMVARLREDITANKAKEKQCCEDSTRLEENFNSHGAEAAWEAAEEANLMWRYDEYLISEAIAIASR